MTTFVLAMLTIIAIVLIGRYYGSATLASNLLLTLAFSVVVGLGIQFTMNKKHSKKEIKIERTINNPISMSTQSVAVLEPDTIACSGAVSQTQNWIVKSIFKGQQPNPLMAQEYKCGSFPFPDSS